MAFDLGGFLKKRWDTSVIRDAVSSNTAADQQRRQVAAQKAAPVQQPKVPYYGSFSPQVTNTEQAVQQTGRDLGRQQREGQITGQQFNDRFAQLLASTTKDSGYKTPMAQAGNFAKSIVKPYWETGDTVVKGAQLGVANLTNNQQAADNARLRRNQSYQDSIVKPVAQSYRMVADTPVGYLMPGNSARKNAEKQIENNLVELRNNTENFTQNKAKEIQDGIRAGIYDPQKAQAAIQELLAVNESANAQLGQFYDEKLASQGLNKDMTGAQAYATAFGNLANTAGLAISPASGATIKAAGGNVVRRGLTELGTNSALNAAGGVSSAYGQGANLEDSLKAGATQAGVGVLMMGAGYLKGMKGPAAVETNIPAAPNSLREQIQVAKNNVRLTINNPDEANVFKVNNPLDAKTTGLDINNPLGAQTKPLEIRNPMGAETGKKLSIMDRYRQATDIDAPNQDGALFPKNDAPQVGKTDPIDALKQEALKYKSADEFVGNVHKQIENPANGQSYTKLAKDYNLPASEDYKALAKATSVRTEMLKKQGKITPKDEGYWSTPIKGQPKTPIPEVKDTNGLTPMEGDKIEFDSILPDNDGKTKKGTATVRWSEPSIANASGKEMPGQWLGNGALDSNLPFTIVERNGKPIAPQVGKTPTTIDNVKLPSGYHTVTDITKELKRQGITQKMLDDTQAIDMGTFDNSGKVETDSVLYFLKENSKPNEMFTPQVGKTDITPSNAREIGSYSTPKPVTEYKVGERVSSATMGGKVEGTITKVPDFSKDLRFKGNDFTVKLDDGTTIKTGGSGFDTPVAQVGKTPKKEFTPISQPVDSVPAVAKRVNEPQQRGFTKSVQEAPNVDPTTKKLVNSEYKPKENDALMGEAKALLSEGASIDFKNTKNLDQKVAATIQEAINAQARGDHAAAAALYNNLSEHGTELGRGVQAFALLENMSPESVSLSVAGRIKKYNATHRRQIPELNGAQQKQISEKIIAADLLKGREKNIALNELDNLVSSYIPSSFADKAITVWKAGLLTSFRTHERNFIGNAVHGVAETVKDVPASAADMLMSAKTGKRTVTSTVGGIKEGLGAFGSKSTRQQIKDIVSKGYDPSEQINKFDYKKITWGNNLVEKGLKGYTEAVFRTLGASDKPFYNSALARSLHNSAAVEAINLGKRGNKAFIENLVKNPTEQMMKDAISDANVATFKNRNQATNVVNDLKRAMNQTEYGKVVAEITMPFTGVPTSILGEIINYSPIGLVKGAAKVGAVTAGKVPDLQRQAAQELGKGVVGTAIFGLGSYLMGQGIMTGQPKDAAEAKQWEVERKPRNSIFIGGKWRSLNSLGPEAVVFLAGAKAQEAKSNPEGSGAEYGLNLGKDYLDQSFVKGLQSPVNALTDPKRYGKSYLGQTASSVVPNIIKDATRALDPTQRETNTVGDYLKNSTPGLSKTLLPRRDSLGNPMAQEPTGVNAFVDLFNSKTPVKGSVIDEMKRLKTQQQDVMPPTLDKKIKIDGTDVQLTDAQRNSLRGSIGKTIQTTWDATIKTPEYRALPVEKQSQTLKNIASDAREAELRRFASRNKLGQYGDNFTGKAGELTVNQANMVNNKFDSTAYTTKTSTGKTKVQSDYDVASSNRSLTMTRAKASNDLNTWIKAAGEEYNAIGEQIKALDPKTDQVKINTLIKKQEALQRTALGYKANGYIKKTTKATGKGSKGGKFTIPTSSVASSARTSTFTNLNRLLAGTTKTNSNKGKIGNKVALRKITVKGVKS